MPSSPEYSFAVIIPSKSAANLIPCLAALRQHEPTCPIVVVDDGLAQEAVYRASSYCRPIRFVFGPQPFVFARNCNAGIKAAGVLDGYVLLNDDALLESPGGFALLAATCAEHPEIGCIGATTNVTGQPLQWRQTGGLRVVPHIAFVAVYIPRTTIERVGLLDERYAIDYGCEDRDYCEAVTRAGLKVAVHDGCYVDHASLTSSFRGDPKAPKSFAQNYKLLIEKWGTLVTK